MVSVLWLDYEALQCAFTGACIFKDLVSKRDVEKAVAYFRLHQLLLLFTRLSRFDCQDQIYTRIQCWEIINVYFFYTTQYLLLHLLYFKSYKFLACFNYDLVDSVDRFSLYFSINTLLSCLCSNRSQCTWCHLLVWSLPKTSWTSSWLTVHPVNTARNPSISKCNLRLIW